MSPWASLPTGAEGYRCTARQAPAAGLHPGALPGAAQADASGAPPQASQCAGGSLGGGAQDGGAVDELAVECAAFETVGDFVPLSLREVEEFMLQRGVTVSCETVRLWC